MCQHVRHISWSKKTLSLLMRASISAKPGTRTSRSRLFLERKLMSTKTTFKRVAAVAALALTLGGVSSVSAHAAWAGNADALTVAATTATGVTGTDAKAAFTTSFISGSTGDYTKVTAVLISSPATSVALPTVETTTAVATDSTATVDGAVAKLASGTFTSAKYESGTFNVVLNAAVAGTYVVKLIQTVADASNNAGTSLVASTMQPTITFTITAAATADAASTTSVIKSVANSAASWAAGTDGTKDSTVLASMGTVADSTIGVKVAVIKVTPQAATTDLTTSTTLSATISGPGTLSVATADTGGTVAAGRAVTGAKGDRYFGVYSDGTPGVGTITISAGTTVLATETVTFFGTAAKYTATVNNAIVTTAAAADANGSTFVVGTPAYGAVQVLVADANGNPVKGATVYANSSDKTVVAADYLASASSDADGIAYFDIVGLKAGTAAISFTSASSASDLATKTAAGKTILTANPVNVRVGSSTVKSATITFDSSTYQPGAAATVTVALLDASGLPVADGVYSVFTAETTSTLAVLQGSMPGKAVTGTATTAGVFLTPTLTAGQVWVHNSLGTATFTVNMPLASGDVTFSGTGVSTLAAAQAGLKISGSATVGSDSAVQAATDAAQEATDAANAAYDAANNAMDSADAATAAAQDAADNASAALAAVTSLSATVAKLVKSVAAIAAALAKVQKKIGA